MSRSISVGFVADLMSERALAQQQLLTNHMKEKMRVTRKSCAGQKESKGVIDGKPKRFENTSTFFVKGLF